MKNIFSYFLLLICSFLIAHNVGAADYSRYTQKDFQSFVQEVKDGKSLSSIVSDSRTFLSYIQPLVACYSDYQSDFKLPEERLIPFHVINRENGTILSDIYVPYSLLLQRRAINTVFQLNSSEQLIGKSTQYPGVILLTRAMQSDIARKIELEHMVERANKYVMIQEMMQREQEQKEEQKHIATLKQCLEKQQTQFDEELTSYKSQLEKKFKREKATYELMNKIKLSELEEKLKEEKIAYDLLQRLLQESNAKFLNTERQHRNLTIQRNILLCLISLFAAIGWHFYNSQPEFCLNLL